MPATANEVLQEFELESVTTRRVLEKITTDQFDLEAPPEVAVARTTRAPRMAVRRRTD